MLGFHVSMAMKKYYVQIVILKPGSQLRHYYRVVWILSNSDWPWGPWYHSLTIIYQGPRDSQSWVKLNFLTQHDR